MRKAAYPGGMVEYTAASDIRALFVVSLAVEHPIAVGTQGGEALAPHGVVVIPPRPVRLMPHPHRSSAFMRRPGSRRRGDP